MLSKAVTNTYQMEVINHPKAAGPRKRSGTQQASSPLSSQPAVEALRLERTFGSGSCAAPAVACPHPLVPGLLAYSSGSVVVLYDSIHKQQTAFYGPKPRRTPSTGKAYASLAFSRDGCYLAAGERSAQGPEILLWEVSSSRCLQTLKGHKHGVGSLSFSQDGRLLVSTGESYDGQLCVWDWQHGTLLAKQHTQAQVQRACFGEDNGTGASGLTITSVGRGGHFKVWSLSLPGKARDGQFSAGQAVLTPRPASLRDFRTSNFVGVAAAQSDGPTSAQTLLYALTQNGTLLTLRPATRTIDKSVSLQVSAAFALAASPGLIACACAAGVVRLFGPRTLAYKGTLPRPTTARGTSGGEGNGVPTEPSGADMEQAGAAVSAGALFSDAVGCAFDCRGDRLTVVYADRSLMVWDVRNPAKVTRVRSVLSHSGIVWNAALIPTWQASLLGPSVPAASPDNPDASFGPSSVLITCGADGTMRLWNVCLHNSASTAGPLGLPADEAGAARVARTLRATIYVSQPNGQEAVPGAPGGRCTPDAPLPVPGGGTTAAPKPIALRSLRVSPCGRHLAAGDARGNLRIYSLATLDQLMLKEAHDAEILSLDYSPPSMDGSCYLASASRDMLVHVYDMSRGYELVGTCDAHLGAVTAVRFSAYGGRLALLSCSADKSVVFRFVQLGSCGVLFEIYHVERMPRGVLYDMAVDPAGSRAVTVGNDKQLRLFDVTTGQPISSFSCEATCGEAVAVTLDPTGSLAVCSCADGGIAIYDLIEGTLLARGSGHSDVCTGAVLLEDYRGLVTVGGDGCALVWRLPPRLAQRMQEAAAECRKQLEQQAAAHAAMVKQQAITPALPRRKAWDTRNVTAAVTAADLLDDEPQQVHVNMMSTLERIRKGKPILSVERLPKWAQLAHTRGFGDSNANTASDKDDSANATPQPVVSKAIAHAPAGKWARQLAEPGTAAPAPDPPAPEPQARAAEPVVTASMAARAAALAEEPRTWAEAVEEDDEIVFCDALDEGQLPGAPQDAAPDADGGLCAGAAGPRGSALMSPREPTVAALVEDDDGVQDGAMCGEHGGAGGRELLGLPRQEKDGAGVDPLEEPASGCASNRLGGPVAEENTADGDIKRDLFREHFDSLGIDQLSASKPLAPDPRRLSFTHMYRQARASGAGAQPDSASLLLRPKSAAGAAPATVDAGATAPAIEAGVPTTPLLAKLPLPPAINATRGGIAVAACEQDGAVTSAWTPERAMLPLTSPALLNADKQIQELARMRLRLERLSSAVLGGAQSVNPVTDGDAAAAPAAAAVTPAAPKLSRQDADRLATQLPPQPLPQQQHPATGLAPAATSQAEQACGEVPTRAAPVPAPTNPHGCAPVSTPPAPVPAVTPADAHAREETSYGGGAFLLPPPRFPTGATAQPASPSGSGPARESPPSPSFSSLSTGTSMLGHRSDDATPCARPREDATAATAGGEPSGVLVLNPIFGATPGTPVFGLVSGQSDRGLQPGTLQAVTLAHRPALVQPLSPPPPPPPPAEEVIRAVLGSAGGDGGVGDSGVCVVTKDGLGPDGCKWQPQQAQPPCIGMMEEPAEVAAGTEAAATGQAQQRRPKQVLPPIRPKRDSPAKLQAAAPASAATATMDTSAGAPPALAPDVSSEDVVSQLNAALRNVASMCQHLQAGGGVQATPAPDAAVQQCHQAYKAALAALEDLFAGMHTTMWVPTPADRPVLGSGQRASVGADVPPMVACPSPRVAVDGSEAGPHGSRLGPRGSQAVASRSVTLAAVSGEVTSSLVVVEVVEQVVQQRMAEERRRMQEDIKRMLAEELRNRL